MIKTRLIRLLNKSKKYIVYQVLWQYLSLICQILLIASAASLLGSLLDGTLDTTVLTIRAVTICICIALRVFCEYRVSRASYARKSMKNSCDSAHPTGSRSPHPKSSRCPQKAWNSWRSTLENIWHSSFTA